MTEADKGSVHVLMPIRTIDHEVQRTEAPAPAASPVPVPVQPQSIKKETPPMKKTEETQPASEPGALDKVLVAYEAAREAVQKAHQALADVARSVRDAIREQKAQSREIAEVRAGLAKLQTIRV